MARNYSTVIRQAVIYDFVALPRQDTWAPPSERRAREEPDAGPEGSEKGLYLIEKMNREELREMLRERAETFELGESDAVLKQHLRKAIVEEEGVAGLWDAWAAATQLAAAKLRPQRL